jgi:hypothetical protein
MCAEFPRVYTKKVTETKGLARHARKSTSTRFYYCYQFHSKFYQKGRMVKRVHTPKSKGGDKAAMGVRALKKITFSTSADISLPTFTLSRQVAQTTRRFPPGSLVFGRGGINTPKCSPSSGEIDRSEKALPLVPPYDDVGGSSPFSPFNPSTFSSFNTSTLSYDTFAPTRVMSASFEERRIAGLKDIIQTCQTLVAVEEALLTCVKIDEVTAELEKYDTEAAN